MQVIVCTTELVRQTLEEEKMEIISFQWHCCALNMTLPS